tara:strand:+ start:530 stop:1165 length:636 start_codon:yes stop_codon:yes gene_type:complete
LNSNWINDNNDYLIYVGDAMCSWCYGFSNELDTIIKNNPKFKLKLIMGGLRPNSSEKAIDMANFLKSHWVEINKRTNQPFSYDILKDPDFVYDTEPASRSILVARTMNPEIEYDFFKAVQTSFYRDNNNTNNLETYIPIAAKFDLDLNAFEKFFNADEIKTRTKADFHLSQQLGIKGFPSLILKKGADFTQLSNGYNEAENIQAIIEKVLS